MDSDSIEDRFMEMQIDKSDNVENAKESMEEVPKILSSEISDVFHVFVNMLDIKSFMKLAMTSKDMYKRCMEDNQIKISVEMNYVSVRNKDGSVEFESYFGIPKAHHDSYIAALQKLPCEVNLGALEMSFQPGLSMESKLYEYTKEIKVNKIHELRLYNDVKETIFSIIKDFEVNVLCVYCRIKDDILRSILQLNLEKFTYHEKVTVDFILGINSPIREIEFPAVKKISKKELMDILPRVQSGSLRRLSVDEDAVRWKKFNSLSFEHEGPLPDRRPLLFERYTREDCYYYDSDYEYEYECEPIETHEYWFLHSDGGVTQCTLDNNLEIFKCDPWEYPWILRKEEDILKDLSEKHPRVSCSKKQFHTFVTSFTMVDPSHEGPLPDARPLSFKTDESNFWLLTENDTLMNCTWEVGFATWKTYSPKTTETFGHPVLAKYMFWKVLEQMERSDQVSFSCKGMEEFDSWFVNFSQLPFDYSDRLPSARPLVFERPSSKLSQKVYVVLLDDLLLQCELISLQVFVKSCRYLNRPPILFTAENVVEMLQDPKDVNIAVNLTIEEFLDGLNQFKQSPSVIEKRFLISEWMTDRFWYLNDAKIVWKVVWEEGSVSLSYCDLRGSPPSFMKQVFRIYIESNNYNYPFMELEEFNNCLEQFTVVPFDYSGPITSDSPMAFTKNEIHHICYRRGSCQCSDPYVVVWFLWNGTRVTKCSWGENTPKKVRCDTYVTDVPPALKSKEYLKFLLFQAKYDKSSRFEWRGRVEEFRAMLKDYVKLPFNYEGPLPEDRPLLFENDKHSYSYNHCLLRTDGTIIMFSLSYSSSVVLSLASSDDCQHVPPALKSMM